MAATFWKPGTARPGSSLDRATEAEDFLDAGAAASQAGPSSSIHAQRQHLPIFKHRKAILYAVQTFPVTIVVGQTGCGKTTREQSTSQR